MAIGKYIFLNKYILILVKISLKYIPYGPTELGSIGSGNGSVSKRWQAITWTNFDKEL